MVYHPRIESGELASFVTSRSRNSELWFVNNRNLEFAILGYLAKYAERYKVKLYGIAIEGNYIQGPALFPLMNRAHFMRDLNSSIARAVPRFTPEYRGGRFWGRRYSSEFLPGADDIEEYFFYTALQPIKDGLVKRLSDYPGYHFFRDAVWGIERKYKVVRWKEYNDAMRYGKIVSIKDFTDIVTLKYERLPGYEDLSQKDYARLMYRKLEERRRKIIEERGKKPFVGKPQLLQTKRGTLPRTTKSSTLRSHRPRILCICPERRAQYKAWYFSIYFDYKHASKEYREGNPDIIFPIGTYKPQIWFKPQEIIQ